MSVKHNKKRAMLLQGHHMMQHIFAYTQLSCYLHDSLLFTFHETLILASYRNRITAKYTVFRKKHPLTFSSISP